MAINIKANGGLKRDPQRIINCVSVCVCKCAHPGLSLCLSIQELAEYIQLNLLFSKESRFAQGKKATCWSAPLNNQHR